MDFSPVARLCERLGVPYSRVETEIGPIIFEHRKENNPCSLCAKMRRGALNQALLEQERPRVALLINASGFGKFRAVMDTPLEVNLNMVDLNCKAVMALCQLTVPYMPSGSQIINIASVAAFQPIPYINVYGATKALVLHYSRALNRELKKQGVHVMAVCPFWTKTEFFDRAVASDEKPVVKKYIAMYKPEEIVAQAWKDAKKGKDMSKCGFKARLQALGVKILPHSMVMDTWLRQQELE